MKVVTVSYMNTWPFLYGMDNFNFPFNLELEITYPSRCGDRFLDDDVDVALVPTGSLLSIKDYKIISDYGICSDGEVLSVGIVSDSDLKDITTLYLDYQSKTSILLAQMIIKEHNSNFIKIVETHPNQIPDLKKNEGWVVIGDRALEYKKQYKCFHDLGVHWKDSTGFPFVYAVWVAKNHVDESQILCLEEAFELGVNSISQVVIDKQHEVLPFNLLSYLTTNIKYKMNGDYDIGKNMFMEKAKAYFQFQPNFTE